MTNSLESLQGLAEILAFLGVAIFFFYRAVTGYLRVNLSVGLDCERQPTGANDKDFLAINLKLRKGENSSLTLHDIQARISYGETVKTASFEGVGRSNIVKSTDGTDGMQIDWEAANRYSPHLKLVPGEEVQLSCHFEVPSNCLVDVLVVVVGRKTNQFTFGQWKASSISLPTAAQRC